MSLGNKIKQLRKEKRMTQAELGALLGVKKSAIQKYENGMIKNIKAQTIERLSVALDVSPSYLLGFKFDDDFDVQKLKEEVKLYEAFSNLNEDGIKKLLSYADDIHCKYKKKDDDNEKS